MLRDLSIQAVFMGLLTAFVGFASAFAVVLQGLRAAGASEAQAASGLMAVSIAMGLCAIVLSVKDRLPVWIAWSTPGAALLATTGAPEQGFPEAVGAFAISGLLIVIAGFLPPITRAVSAIPTAIASAMLAGILLGLCMAPFQAIAEVPALGLPIAIAWVVVYAINPRFAVPAALFMFILVMYLGVDLPVDSTSILRGAIWPQPEIVAPVFTLQSAISIAFPLFVVTMASQNIPGLAVLKTNGFPLKPKLWFTTTGFFTLAGTPFGGHAVNLAAITAAMCASAEAHPDPARRYWAAIVAGLASILLGVFAGFVTTFVTLAPIILIEAVAGLALISTFVSSIQSAFDEPTSRVASGITFLLTASGVSIAGISGAFWGLIAGVTLLWISNKLRRK